MTTRTIRTLGMGLVASSLLLALPAAAQTGGFAGVGGGGTGGGGTGGKGGVGGVGGGGKGGNQDGPCQCSAPGTQSNTSGGALAALALAAGVGTVVARSRRK